MAEIRIGISGWRYAPWRGVFYPKGLPQREELSWASRALPTIGPWELFDLSQSGVKSSKHRRKVRHRPEGVPVPAPASRR